MQILESSQKSTTGFLPRQVEAGVVNASGRADDPRWQLAQRIAASGSLGRSRLLVDFLLYIVDRHIGDRFNEITEQQIGVLVFGRAEGYDSNEDNIVRSYARNLRKRIEEYYATEGQEETLLLEIPRGGYVPSFSVRAPETVIEGEADSLLPPEIAPRENVEGKHSIPEASLVARPYRTLVVLFLGIAIGLGISLVLTRPGMKHALASASVAESHKLWTQLFRKDRDTVIVPSDDGLIIMQSLVERPVPLADYLNGTYRTNLKNADVPGAPEILKLGQRRYTSVVDLDLVSHLAQLDDVVPERTMVRYARDLRMDDLRTGNAILIGSSEANPWIELFEPQMSFRFSIHPGNEMPSGIVNLHPRVGENTIYGTPTQDHTYGLIAYLPNLSGTGKVLIVAGLNTAGTEAAAKFLLTPELMLPVLRRAEAAHGDFQRFELLIGAGNVATNASSPQLVLERIGPSYGRVHRCLF